MKGVPSSLKRLAAVTVLAICIRESTPSCIRLPPPDTIATTGRLFRAAVSKARATFSPTTMPMLPPMNPKSSAATITSMSSIRHRPVTAASVSPVELWSWLSRLRYLPLWEKDSGSVELRYLWDSLNDPLSASSSMRSLAVRV